MKTKINVKYIIGGAIVLAGIAFWIWKKSAIITEEVFLGCTFDLLSVIISVAGAIFVVLELQGSKELQEAEFIVNLNQSFVRNEHYAEMYSKLEKNDDSLTTIEISNYLTFFETTYILMKKKVITIDVLDDLFAYRFFLAVHNKRVQEIKLVDAPYNFRNIYHLEKLWMDYRKEKNLKIHGEDNSIEIACKKAGKQAVYDEIIKGKRA